MSKIGTWVRTHVWASVVLAALIGVGIGGASSSASSEEDRLTEQNHSLEVQVENLRNDLEAAREDADASQQDYSTVQARVTQLEKELQTFKAKRPMPSVVGDSIGDVESLADQYGWDVQTTEEGSAKPEGTVLSQTPAAGTTMKLGAVVNLVVAQPLPPGWKDIKVFSGSGDIKTPEVNIPDGKVRLLYTFSGNSNAQITLYQRPNEFIENYLNEIGDYSASTRVYYSGRYYFEICCGSWTVRLQEFK
jgi:outer membrane murein-binding lipoprotein Lpp